MKLQVRDLAKSYPTRRGTTHALGPLSFEVASGEFVSLLGPSGCGKSTALYLVAGLEPASAGEIWLDDQLIMAPGPDRGMVFQNYTLFPWLTVRQNVRFSDRLACNRHSLPGGRAAATAATAARNARAEYLLDWMGLGDFALARPRELSGGMKQRVAIARALVNRPAVLLMDEPLGALDAQTREEMQDLLLQLSRHEQTTILFVTHDVEEAIFLSTRVLVLSPRPGQLIADVTVPFTPRERTSALKLDPTFLSMKREILALLHRTPVGVARDDLFGPRPDEPPDRLTARASR
jgi:NitT/TauT family transport system ATP-binding protein